MLNFMVSIVLELTLRVAAAMWASSVINGITGATAEGFTNQSLQQGGSGLLMTVLLVSTPPMAAAFFGGTMGQFTPYAQVNAGGGASQPGPQGQPPGSWSGFSGGAGSPADKSAALGMQGYSRPNTTQSPTLDTVKPHQGELGTRA